MLVLRATQKVLRQLPPPAESVGESDTALGDWYVNRIMVGRQPVLMLVSAASLLSALVPARDVRGLAERVAGIVANRLHALEVPELLVERELLAMESVVVAMGGTTEVGRHELTAVVRYLIPSPEKVRKYVVISEATAKRLS